MMDSVTRRMQTSNKIFTIIRNFEHMFPDQFEKTDIKKCDKCQGGFRNITVGYEVESNICDNCRGLGYYGFDRMYTDIVCKNCYGTGCHICDNGLITDWLDKIMRPDKQARKKENNDLPF